MKELLNSGVFLAEALQEATRRNNSLYDVICLESAYPTCIASGSKDYCYGYYSALDSARCTATAKYVIVCENVIIYPEDRFGEVLSGVE